MRRATSAEFVKAVCKPEEAMVVLDVRDQHDEALGRVRYLHLGIQTLRLMLAECETAANLRAQYELKLAWQNEVESRTDATHAPPWE